MGIICRLNSAGVSGGVTELQSLGSYSPDKEKGAAKAAPCERRLVGRLINLFDVLGLSPRSLALADPWVSAASGGTLVFALT